MNLKRGVCRSFEAEEEIIMLNKGGRYAGVEPGQVKGLAESIKMSAND